MSPQRLLTTKNPIGQLDKGLNALVAALPVLAALTYFAIAFWVLLTGHLNEDAYILFTYVENLAQGKGIVYYAGGPPAEGATDFLWMACLAAARWMGLDAGVAAAALNALGIGAICHIAVKYFPESIDPTPRLFLAVCVTALVVSSPLMVAGITGFGSPLFAAVAIVLFSKYYDTKYNYLPWGGLLLGLIRPDGVIIGCSYALLGLASQWRSDHRRRYLLHLLMAGVAGSAYFIWRFDYFGHLLPLPLYVKSAGEGAFAGVTENLEWLAFNLPLICVAMTVFAHRSIKRRRLALALIPFLLLLLSLGFAQQTQNVAYRFQAPATAMLIILFAMAVSRWLVTITRLPAALIVASGFVLIFSLHGIFLVRNTSYIRHPQYIDYFPYHLAEAVNDSTSIALTEAGRMAYWTGGRKYDLVGLNTAYPAVKGLDVDYLEALQPDLFFIHTAETLLPWPPQTVEFFEVTIEEIRHQIKRDKNWRNESDPIKRAPLVVYDFLEGNEHAYELLMVRYHGRFSHLYALRKDGDVDYGTFVAILGKSFTPGARISYWEMKRRRSRP